MMGRSSSCDRHVLKKGLWTPEEDRKLVDCLEKHGYKTWRTIPKLAGLKRCGLSCRLRWTNYLRPGIKREKFSEEEEQIIINLHRVLGNKWSAIVTLFPGQTDNEIKNVWNSYLRKKLLQMGIDPITHRPRTDLNILANLPQLLGGSNFGNSSNNPWDIAMRLQSDVTQLAKIQLLHNIIQALNSNPSQNIDSPNRLGSSFPDQQSAGFLPMNSQFEGDSNFPIGFVQDDPNDQIHSNFSHFESSQILHHDYLALEPADANFCINNQIGGMQLVSSPDQSSSVNQMENNKMNPNDIFNVNSSSNALEGFGDLLDDEALLTMERDFRGYGQASLEHWEIS